MKYDEFFKHATAVSEGPYPYQQRLACGEVLPTLLDIPTGLGKTAAVILAWLWRRRFAGDDVRKATPRRLVYCLPMRTLVEQTKTVAERWVANLAACDKIFSMTPADIHVLMGGEAKTNWDTHPERDAILIGTQDMLLSRALNRGYGMSRYRWPIHFSLLNNDCLWVMDETQLMGVGLTTSAQLQGLREKLNTYGISKSLWMSATMDDRVLGTVDHPRSDDGWSKLELRDEDRASAAVKRLVEAAKPCYCADVALTPDSEKSGYDADLAKQIMQAHRPGTLTLVVVNQVERAQQVFRATQKIVSDDDRPGTFLIHSRYRKYDREKRQQTILDEKAISPDGFGRILIATQAIEAGVDISATTLFTELAPWSSLVQRFGRCNRRGTCGTDGEPEAQVFWIDFDTADAKKSKQLALPYPIEELDAARELIDALSDVGPTSLEVVEYDQPLSINHVLRRKDLLELWDTTSDLAGNDLDVSRYIRDGDDTDVQVYWRYWEVEKKRPPDQDYDDGNLVFPAALPDELCAVSVGKATEFLQKLRKHNNEVGNAWQWNQLERTWDEIDPYHVRPGMVILLHVDAGGYDPDIGWTGNVTDRPTPIPLKREDCIAKEANDDDNHGEQAMTLIEHTRRVVSAAETLKKRCDCLPAEVPWEKVVEAARWHDVGKAHPAFQIAMRDCATIVSQDPEATCVWAKSGERCRLNYRVDMAGYEGNPRPSKRRGFRHELASALVWLEQSNGATDADLIAFLIAAHHGKVRGSVRSMPNEKQPSNPNVKYARGLWDGDEIPPVELDNGLITPKLRVDLSLMELGEDEHGRPSWLARVLKLRDQYGPFRLSYLETLLRIADWHGSNEGGTSND